MEFAPELLALLFIVACIAGFIDAAAGGGGLITIPVLLLTGMQPVEALGTNKLQACFGSFSASLHFLRHGLVKPLAITGMISSVAIASAVGAYTVQQISPQGLLAIMPLIFIGIALYSLWAKNLGQEVSAKKINEQQFSFSVAPVVGFYDGFAGPGTGTFFAHEQAAITPDFNARNTPEE